jgi:hypothetical protein
VIELLLYAAFGLSVAAWLCLVAIARPRLFLYLIIALAPTQFLFIPVSDFFISPAVILTAAATFALLLRLATLQKEPWLALYQHRFVILMIASYFVGFVVHGVFSRTIVRLPMALVASILACELLHTRRHLVRAATALVVAGALDAAYGLFAIARDGSLPGNRFRGMSDVNFAAMQIATAAVISLALLARTGRPLKLTRPGALAGLALSTLSQMGVLALLAAWVTVLRRIVSRANRTRIITAAIVLLTVVLLSPLRERILNRNVPVVQQDGSARNSAEVRWMIATIAWTAFLTNPVLGLGYNQFLPFSTRHPDIAAWSVGKGYPTHSTYLETLVEGGVIALGFFALHLWQFRRFPAVIRMAVVKHDEAVAASLVGLPVILVCAAFANVLLMYSFWMVAGLALAGLNLVRREEKELDRATARGHSAH